jgi:hypothetical protein
MIEHSPAYSPPVYRVGRLKKLQQPARPTPHNCARSILNLRCVPTPTRRQPNEDLILGVLTAGLQRHGSGQGGIRFISAIAGANCPSNLVLARAACTPYHRFYDMIAGIQVDTNTSVSVCLPPTRPVLNLRADQCLLEMRKLGRV